MNNTYDPIKYWNEREYPCWKATVGKITPLQIEYVSENVEECEKIIDFGPGFGRLFPAYKNAKSVIGYDISSKYKDQIYEEAENYSFKFNLIVDHNIGVIHYSDDYFDAAVAAEVFLHQTPDKILDIMKELSRVAKKVIVISFMDPKKVFGRDNSLVHQYCFNYNYLKICEENGMMVENNKVLNNQLYFVYKRR